VFKFIKTPVFIDAWEVSVFKQLARVVFKLVLCSFIFTGCASGPSSFASATPTFPVITKVNIPEVYWPTQEWRSATPEELGMDVLFLQQMFEYIQDQALNIHGVVVVRYGYIAAEKYYAPYNQSAPHAIYSCTKSVMSALIGIALAEGLIDDLDQDVLSFFPELTFANVNAWKEKMKLANLLTMQSGLSWQDGMPTYIEMGAQEDVIHYVLDRSMVAEPGSEFNYCSGCSHLLSIIVQRIASEGTLAFAKSRLFDPLGITDVVWELDRRGTPNGGWGLALTPRDMAKIGYLYLREGIWDGNQIIPAGWVRESTGQQVAIEDGLGYGYQWWVYPLSGLYAARGYQQQAIFVHPELDLVVVITAKIDDLPGDILLDMVEEYVIQSVAAGN
jgi:CubicO group peptidase (beta-lactamase class C family)